MRQSPDRAGTSVQKRPANRASPSTQSLKSPSFRNPHGAGKKYRSIPRHQSAGCKPRSQHFLRHPPFTINIYNIFCIYFILSSRQIVLLIFFIEVSRSADQNEVYRQEQALGALNRWDGRGDLSFARQKPRQAPTWPGKAGHAMGSDNGWMSLSFC